MLILAFCADYALAKLGHVSLIPLNHLLLMHSACGWLQWENFFIHWICGNITSAYWSDFLYLLIFDLLHVEKEGTDFSSVSSNQETLALHSVSVHKKSNLVSVWFPGLKVIHTVLFWVNKFSLYREILLIFLKRKQISRWEILYSYCC